MFAVEDFFEPTDGFSNRNILAGGAGEDFGDMERLAEEPLNLARAEDGQLVFRAEFVHAEDRDDVLQILVALEHFLHATRDRVVLFAHDLGRERLRGRSEWIDRRINAQL